MLMTDNQIELEEPVVRRAQQNNRNKKSVFDRANRPSTSTNETMKNLIRERR